MRSSNKRNQSVRTPFGSLPTKLCTGTVDSTESHFMIIKLGMHVEVESSIPGLTCVTRAVSDDIVDRGRGRVTSAQRAGARCCRIDASVRSRPASLVRVPLGRRDVTRHRLARGSAERCPAGSRRGRSSKRSMRLPPLRGRWCELVDFAAELLPARRRRAGAGGAAARAAPARATRSSPSASPGCARRSRAPRRRSRRRQAAPTHGRAARRAGRGSRRSTRARPRCCTASPAAARPRSTCARPSARSTPAGRRWCWCPRST